MTTIELKGTVVGTSNGTSKASGNPYTMVTAVIGGEPMTLMLSRDGGSLDGVVPMTEQTLRLGLSAYRTEARIDFLGVKG